MTVPGGPFNSMTGGQMAPSSIDPLDLIRERRQIAVDTATARRFRHLWHLKRATYAVLRFAVIGLAILAWLWMMLWHYHPTRSRDMVSNLSQLASPFIILGGLIWLAHGVESMVAAVLGRLGGPLSAREERDLVERARRHRARSREFAKTKPTSGASLRRCWYRLRRSPPCPCYPCRQARGEYPEYEDEDSEPLPSLPEVEARARSR